MKILLENISPFIYRHYFENFGGLETKKIYTPPLIIKSHVFIFKLFQTLGDSIFSKIHALFYISI